VHGTREQLPLLRNVLDFTTSLTAASNGSGVSVWESACLPIPRAPATCLACGDATDREPGRDAEEGGRRRGREGGERDRHRHPAMS
jgi:hypothetical protein